MLLSWLSLSLGRWLRYFWFSIPLVSYCISGRLLTMIFWHRRIEKENECSGVTLSFFRAYQRCGAGCYRFLPGRLMFVSLSVLCMAPLQLHFLAMRVAL